MYPLIFHLLFVLSWNLILEVFFSSSSFSSFCFLLFAFSRCVPSGDIMLYFFYIPYAPLPLLFFPFSVQPSPTASSRRPWSTTLPVRPFCSESPRAVHDVLSFLPAETTELWRKIRCVSSHFTAPWSEFNPRDSFFVCLPASQSYLST